MPLNGLTGAVDRVVMPVPEPIHNDLIQADRGPAIISRAGTMTMIMTCTVVRSVGVTDIEHEWSRSIYQGNEKAR